MDDRLSQGKILKQAREAKGISLASVHESTKIPMDSLRAIEEGYKVRTLTDFYYRSFTKLYARHLGVDLALLTDQPVETKAQQSIEKIKKKPVPSSTFLSYLTPDLKLKIAKAVVGLVLLLILFRVGGCLLRHSSARKDARVQQQQAATSQDEKAKIPAVEQKPIEQLKTPAPATSQPSQVPVVGKNDNIQRVNVVIRAKKKTWIQVSVDEQVVFRSTLDKGAVESWSGSEQVELSIKNITDLDVEYNGRILDALGSAARNPRKILFSPSGFKIED